MKHLLISTIALGLTLTTPAGLSASTTDSGTTSGTEQKKKGNASSSQRDSFEEFRASIYKDYEEFRGRILDHYADFLAGEWHPFEPFEIPKKYEQPKPKTPPVATDKQKDPGKVSPTQKPIEVIPTKPSRPKEPTSPVKPAKPVKPAEPMKPAKPVTPVKPAEPVKPAKPATPVKPTEPVKPTKPVEPITPAKPEKPSRPTTPTPPAPAVKPEKPSAPAKDVEANGPTFQFYGFDVPAPKAHVTLLPEITKDAEAAQQWKNLDKSQAGKTLAVELGKQAAKMGLNGYLTYRLIDSYLRSEYPSASEFSRQSAAHYLMSQMGFDVRLSYFGNRTPLILMPFNQQVYGSIGLELNGRKYTAILPDGYTPQDIVGQAIYTCQLPNSGELGTSSDLKINRLNIPVKARDFTITGGEITISGKVNENIKNILHHYPQMPTEDFASSVIDPELRKSVVEQVRSQLNGKSEKDAVNALMRFFHKMPYATDGEFHGFEKPYFLEENFIYPKNDCEDRAIFFTYLLWNALGLQNQLLAYPGHESAAVALDENVGGTSYTYDGKVYYSADPTYIGSTVGMCADSYRGINPTVDKVYR